MASVRNSPKTRQKAFQAWRSPPPATVGRGVQDAGEKPQEPTAYLSRQTARGPAGGRGGASRVAKEKLRDHNSSETKQHSDKEQGESEFT